VSRPTKMLQKSCDVYKFSWVH